MMLLPNALRISDKRYVRLTTFPRAQQQLQDWNNIAKNLAVWSDGGIHRKQTTSVIEHGVSKLKRTPGPRSITDQLALGLIEGVLTVLGLIVLVFPLALWAVPQHGPLANTVFYIVLSIGSGSLTGLIALAYLKSILFPRQSSDAAPMSGKARLQAYQNWEQTQEDAQRVKRQLRSLKGGALHNLGYMARIATLIATVVSCLYLGTWAMMDFYYGSTEIMSSEARYQLIHPDSWDWRK